MSDYAAIAKVDTLLAVKTAYQDDDSSWFFQ
jgi:hypothetical protein